MLKEIENQFDTENAEKIVTSGYPKNKKFLVDLIFWSCFPNDPVCLIIYPYVSSLDDEILAPAMAEFISFHLANNQEELVDIALDMFVNERVPRFKKLIISSTEDDLVKEILAKYSGFGQVE